MMRVTFLFGVIAALSATATRAANACTTAADTSLRTTPPAGSSSVPTDVAILVDLWQASVDSMSPLPDGLCTLRTLDGEVVPSTTERVAVWHAEVKPAVPLAPNTRYELEVVSPVSAEPQTAIFTTGAGPLDAAPGPLDAALQHWEFAPDVQLDSCAPNRVGTCVSLPEGALVESLFLLADGREADPFPYLFQGPFTADITENNAGHPYRCLRLRQRALNGIYGDATVLCSADAPTVQLSGNPSLSCSSTGIQHAENGEPQGDPVDGEGVDGEVDGATQTSAGDDLGAYEHPDAEFSGNGDSGIRCGLAGGSAGGGSGWGGSIPCAPLGVLAALGLVRWRRRR